MHNTLLVSYHSISTDTIIAVDSSPMDLPKGNKVTLQDIIMGIWDPYNTSLALFQEVWTGVMDNKTHFVVLLEQEPTVTECIDVIRQIVHTRYTSYNAEGNTRFWQWFTQIHRKDMRQITFNETNHRWILDTNNHLKEILLVTNDFQLLDKSYAETEAHICMISGIQIVDAHWQTSRMGGIVSDQDLLSISTWS